MDNLLDRFARTLAPGETEILADVRAYVEWLVGSERAFRPRATDDVHLRTYLLALRIDSPDADPTLLHARIDSLQRFYAWALAEGLIESDPFVRCDLDRFAPDRHRIRRRAPPPGLSAGERELQRLQALNRLAEDLNGAASVQTALDAALAAVVEVMGLQTAWISLLRDARSAPETGRAAPPHGFELGAAVGLPPALEADDCAALRRPPECRCQSLLRAGQLTRPVNVVECSRLGGAASTGDTGGLLFHATVPILSHGQPLGLLNVATDEWEFLTASDLHLLSAIGAQIAVALERARLYDRSDAQLADLAHEMEMARAMQATLLPDRLPRIPGFNLAAHWRPARELGGDFYNIFRLPAGCWGIVIADVADKGASAALYMAIANTMIRARAAETASPAATLREVNRELRAASSAVTFVTGLYGILDPAAGTLTYANAGHNPPIVRRAADGIEVAPNGGLVLGIFDDVSLRDERLSLAAGDALVLYTDGLTEATNAAGEEYGVERLCRAVQGGPARAAALRAHVLADQAAFTAGQPQSDDMTLFVISRRTEGPVRVGHGRRRPSPLGEQPGHPS